MKTIESAIVRIFYKNSYDVAGVGFRFSNQHIMTAAHVIANAVGVKRNTNNAPSEDILFDFPLVQVKERHEPLSAQVALWLPPNEIDGDDICVLQIRSTVPTSASIARLVTPTKSQDLSFEAFGIPVNYDNGVWGKGITRRAIANAHIQIDGVSDLGYFLQPGFSGGCVYCENEYGVIGMVVTADANEAIRSGRMIPSSRLIEVFPIAQKFHEDDPRIMNYLETLISDLTQRRGVLEYVDLSGIIEAEEETPSTYRDIDDEFGFSELLVDNKSREKPRREYLGRVRDVLSKYDRFVLIGDAGVSKTTTLRRLAYEAAERRLADRLVPLPLLLYLPRWNNEATPQDFIRSQWKITGLPSEIDPTDLLIQGDAILYLDGLNEMGGIGAKATLLREWLSAKNSPHKMIITCRRDNYLNDFDLGIPIVQIEPMSDEHIRQFARNYLNERAVPFLQRILPASEQEKQNKRHLYHLVKIPYMLAALILIFDTSPTEELPSNAGMLFDRLIKAIGKREAKRQSPGWIPLSEKFPLIKDSLARLAFAMINEDKGIDVSVNYASQYLSKSVIDSAQSANFIEIVGSNIRFYHQLIQEYFAAVMLQENDISHNLERLKGAYPYIARKTTKWDEVVKALVGIVENPLNIVEFLLTKDEYLAAYCATSGIQLSNDLLDEIASFLVRERCEAFHYYEVMEGGAVNSQSYYYDTKHIDELICALGTPAINPLLEVLSSKEPENRAFGCDLLGEIRTEEAAPYIAALLNDDNEAPSWKKPVGAVAKEALKKIGIRGAQNTLEG